MSADLDIDKVADIAKRLRELQSRNSSASQDFASLWGQQNHPEIRLFPYEIKQKISKLINNSVNKQFNFYKNYSPELLDKFKEDGFIVLSDLFKKSSAKSIRKYFEKIDDCCAWHVYNADKEMFSISTRTDQVQGSFKPEDILANEMLVQLFLNDKVLDLVEGYLGAPGRLFHFNTMCSFPSRDSLGQAQDYHRDQSHVKFCVLFVYLSDVDVNSGPHIYFKHTHDKKVMAQKLPELDVNRFFDLEKDGYGQAELYEKELVDVQNTIVGRAGTCILSDPSGIHKGAPVLSGNRLMAWARFAVIPDDSQIKKSLPNDLSFLSKLTERQLYAISSVIANSP